jgi:3-(3-hydroxy-phenyl)propionate hydroxylase
LLEIDGLPVRVVTVSAAQPDDAALRERYLGAAVSAIYLVRPDQHVAARWTAFDPAAVAAALRKAIGKKLS